MNKPLYLPIDHISSFEVKPIEGYKTPINKDTGEQFPDDSQFHKSFFEVIKKEFDKFPNCCDKHRELTKEYWFNISNYNGIIEKIINQLSYTEYQISERNSNNDWYKDITDYIEYNKLSFGKPSVGAEYYLDGLKHYIKYESNLTKTKKLKLIGFIEDYYKPVKNQGTDFNVLYVTYQKWLNIFPFDISFFNELKPFFEKQLPIIDGDPEVNRYTGFATSKIHSKSSLIEVLLNITNNLLTQINSYTLNEIGLLTEPQKIKLELVLNERKLKLKQGYVNNSQNEEERYRKILKEWFADEKAFINDIMPIMKTLPPQQPKENQHLNLLHMVKEAVVTNKWANGNCAQMRYNSKEIWHQVAGYHLVGERLYKNHSDNVLDTVNFPVITIGLTAYLIQNLGKPEHLIFDKYYENRLNNYKQVEARKPGSSMRNLDAEFYPIHIAQEKEFITFSEKIHPYLSKAENELIDQYTEAYFKYIEQVYSPKGSTEEGTLEKQEAGNELSVPDWCIIFYYIDEAGTQEGNKIDRMEKFIEDNNVVSPSSVHTTKSNFKKEYHEIENRINSKNNKKPLPPKRIENILHYLKNNKKALQAAESDKEHLTNEIEEYKRNTY